MTSLADLSSLVSKITATAKDNETLAVPVLAARLDKLAHANPDDTTLVSMYRVFSKFEDNKKFLITRALFKDLYNKHYTTGTRFASYFKNELGVEDAPVKTAKPVEQPPLPLYSAADPVLASALSGLFGKQGASFTKQNAQKAEKIVSASLELWNLATSKLHVVDGDDRFLIVKADYDTPRGITSVFVPVEVVSDKLISPLVFMGNDGVRELNNSNLKGYLTTYAGSKLEVRAGDMVKVLSKAGREDREVGAVEMAVIRMNAKNDGVMCANSVLGQTLDPVIKNATVAIPKAEGYEKLSEKLDTPLGMATLKFGKPRVDMGRDIVCRALLTLGVQSPQVIVAAVANDAIVYAVVGNGSGFNVPVRVVADKVEIPTVLICNGSVLPFERASLDKLGGGDMQALAAVSPQYGLRTSDLIDNVRKAVDEGNHAKAEDALNVLAANGDKEAYKTGLAVYRSGPDWKESHLKVCSYRSQQHQQSTAMRPYRTASKQGLSGQGWQLRSAISSTD